MRRAAPEARTSIASAEAERSRARDDRTRYSALVDKGYVARQRFETASATATTADANVDKARAASTVAQSQVEVSLRRRAELEAAIKQAEAQKAKAEAALALARQDLGDTVIRAPVDGVIGDRKIETGEYVQAGTRLMAVVSSDNLYVVANFKETQTDRMLPGQKAKIYVDALSGDPLEGTVESLAPASGSEFALLPFEPGTGNFTKIVQRVPVRIKLSKDAVLTRLRPGLSGISETITVTSVVGRFLEHARIYYFHNGGHKDVLMGSADLMPRNLDHRVEVIFPVEDPQWREVIINEILGVGLRDNVQARRLLADGTYERVQLATGEVGLNSQQWLLDHWKSRP